MIHTPLDGGHMVQILYGIDIIAETLDVGLVGILDDTYRSAKLRCRELSITVCHPIAVVTLPGSPKRNIANFLDR